MASSDKTQLVSKSSAVVIGTELNQTYKIDALIGVGGMGEVFKGHNIQTGDPVAIKVVLPEYARDEMIFELFRKEARVLNHLNHDAIVRYYVFSLDRSIGRPYLAMEFVDGQSLAEHIKSTPLQPEHFFNLLRRLADGLHKAHEAGVIHRDISPDNVILPDGSVDKAKIIDFGIARSANVGGATLLGGSFAGKYSYVSPEQLGLFGGDVTPKSDIYSLGLMMAAALRGHPIDMSGSQVEVIEKRRTVPPLEKSGIPKQFHAVLTAMLQPDPAQRPENMAAVRDWTEAAKPTKEKSKPSSTKNAAANVSKGTPPSTATSDTSGFRNAAIGLGVLAVIGVGGVGGWIYVQSQKPSSPATKFEQTAQPTPTTPEAKPEIAKTVTAEAAIEKKPSATDPPKPIETKPPELAPITRPAEPAPQPTPAAPPAAPAAPVAKTEPPAALGTPPKEPAKPPVMSGTPPAAVTPPPTPAAKTETPPPAPIAPPKETQVAGLPEAQKPIPKPTAPPAGVDLVALRNAVQKFSSGACFYASIDELTASTAKLTAVGNPQALTQFEKAFADQAGFKPQVKFDPVSPPQCTFIAALNKAPSKSGAPLQVKLNRTDLRGSNADTGIAGDPLTVTVSGVADRNVYLFVVDHDGGIQNINRACPSCITMKNGEMKASLSLFNPQGVDPSKAEPFYPMMVFVAAAGKPLNGINGQDAFDPEDFSAPLQKDASGVTDFSTQVAYLKLKVQ